MPSLNVKTTVGLAPVPAPAEVMVALNRWSVPVIVPIVAVAPQPADNAKSPATKDVPWANRSRLRFRKFVSVAPLNVCCRSFSSKY